MKVVVGASTFADTSSELIDFLNEKGIEVVKNPYKRRMTEDEIIEHLEGADGLLAGLEPLTERVFSSSPQLKSIARIGIGMDNVDIDSARKHGIVISNTPEGPTKGVAEMTLTAILSLIHNIYSMNANLHNGEWTKKIGKSIIGLKVFIIGFGHIGKEVCSLLTNLGADVKKYDKYNLSDSDFSMEKGLKWADVVTLHVSGNDEIIGEHEFEIMREDSFLLNSSRGGVVNENALYSALMNGKIAGFWGDALWQEPYEGKICECQNAILTPHICTYTAYCREHMEKQAVNNIIRDLGL